MVSLAITWPAYEWRHLLEMCDISKSQSLTANLIPFIQNLK